MINGLIEKLDSCTPDGTNKVSRFIELMNLVVFF